MGSSVLDIIDWTPFDGTPLCEVECINRHVFFSHAKFVARPVGLVSRKPCPVCGEHSLMRLSSGREQMMIGKNEVSKL